ncbi:MAG: HAMP domain-containing protein [Melioribacteraceae bacterium]|nr:HAMP domain-containing protein [Melioribacteraceae bacterium]
MAYFHTLRAKVTLILLSSIFTIALILLILDYNTTISDNELTITQEFAQFNELFKTETENKATDQAATLEVLLHDEKLLTLFEERKRDELSNYLLSLFTNTLKPKYKIAQVHFHTEDNHSFLRLHQPSKFGDNLSAFRKTVVRANTEKKIIQGIEVGKYGTGLRNVAPVFNNGNHIGSLEFSGSIYGLLDGISTALKMDYSIGINKETLKNAGGKIGREDVEKADKVYYYFSDDRFKSLLNEIDISTITKDIVFEDKNYSVASIPIMDYSGQKVGCITLYKDITKFYDNVKSSLYSSIVIVLISAVFVALISFFFMKKSLLTPLKAVSRTAHEIADGNYDIRLSVRKDDEIGEVRASINKMVENIAYQKKQLIEEKGSILARIEEAVAQSEASKEYLSTKTSELLSAMGRFSSGDLTVNLKVEKDDDVGKLFKGFNETVRQINALVGEVKSAILATSNASLQILSRAEELSHGSKKQSEQTADVSKAIEQMTTTILESAQNVSVAADSAQEAGDTAENGGKVIGNTINGIESISEVVTEAADAVELLGNSSEKIGEIVGVINDIAEQTNLLALNAAIEAARAGEHGRGFAVVADEVSKLADRTMNATKEISRTIDSIQLETKKAVESIRVGKGEAEKGRGYASEAGYSLKLIMEKTDTVIEQISQVATASEEQSTTAEEVSKNIEMIYSVSMESLAGVQIISDFANEMNQLTQHLRNLIEQFTMAENPCDVKKLS